jgi:ornithine cyclodeaminase/alanine dehydrogenase
VFGAGVQAETQLIAIANVRKLESAKVFDIDRKRAKEFSERLSSSLGIRVEVTDDPEAAVRDSMIIACATTSKTPIFNGQWLREGAHINGIGSHFGPGTKEIDGTAVKRARVIVDSKEACLKEAGDLIDPIKDGLISEDHIVAELGEVIIGKKKGRLAEDEITFFKSVGLALQDISTANLVYQTALKRGIGTQLEL